MIYIVLLQINNLKPRGSTKEVQCLDVSCTSFVLPLHSVCTSPVLLRGITSSGGGGDPPIFENFVFLVDNFEKIVDPTTPHFYDFGAKLVLPLYSFVKGSTNAVRTPEVSLFPP